jgi:hypothetical protein
MDEIKQEQKIDQSSTVNIASFGEGNYGKLMDRLLNGRREDS